MLETTYIRYISEETPGHGFFKLPPGEFTDEDTAARELADQIARVSAERDRLPADVIHIGRTATVSQLSLYQEVA